MLSEVPESRAKIFKEWKQSEFGGDGGGGNYSKKGSLWWSVMATTLKSGKLERKIAGMEE